MPKGTCSKGRRNGKSHCLCPRCGRKSLHISTKVCSHCGFPNKKMRSYNWGQKQQRRTKEGSGRMRYMARALKRRSNRERFERLPQNLQKAILNAKKESGKRMPPRKILGKHLRRIRNAKRKSRVEREKFLSECRAAAKARVAGAS